MPIAQAADYPLPTYSHLPNFTTFNIGRTDKPFYEKNQRTLAATIPYDSIESYAKTQNQYTVATPSLTSKNNEKIVLTKEKMIPLNVEGDGACLLRSLGLSPDQFYALSKMVLETLLEKYHPIKEKVDEIAAEIEKLPKNEKGHRIRKGTLYTEEDQKTVHQRSLLEVEIKGILNFFQGIKLNNVDLSKHQDVSQKGRIYDVKPEFFQELIDNWDGYIDQVKDLISKKGIGAQSLPKGMDIQGGNNYYLGVIPSPSEAQSLYEEIAEQKGIYVRSFSNDFEGNSGAVVLRDSFGDPHSPHLNIVTLGGSAGSLKSGIGVHYQQLLTVGDPVPKILIEEYNTWGRGSPKKIDIKNLKTSDPIITDSKVPTSLNPPPAKSTKNPTGTAFIDAGKQPVNEIKKKIITDSKISRILNDPLGSQYFSGRSLSNSKSSTIRNDALDHGSLSDSKKISDPSTSNSKTSDPIITDSKISRILNDTLGSQYFSGRSLSNSKSSTIRNDILNNGSLSNSKKSSDPIITDSKTSDPASLNPPPAEYTKNPTGTIFIDAVKQSLKEIKKKHSEREFLELISSKCTDSSDYTCSIMEEISKKTADKKGKKSKGRKRNARRKTSRSQQLIDALKTYLQNNPTAAKMMPENFISNLSQQLGVKEKKKSKNRRRRR